MYIEREVLPHLPELKALAVAGAVALYSRKAPELLDKLESKGVGRDGWRHGGR